MAARALDLAGRQFGRLRAVCRVGTRNRQALWSCVCICGKSCVVEATYLFRELTKSCGCWRADSARNIKTKHGHKSGDGGRTTEYRSWEAMKNRCTYNSNPSFKNYGGIGITICGRWAKFENFLADMGLKPSPAHTIDRKDPDGNYEPSNCRWATHKEQAANKRQPCKS